MRVTTTIISLIILNNQAFTQKYMFGHSGTMSQSYMYIDTVIKTQINIANNIRFFKWDKSTKDTLGINKYIPRKYFQSDTGAYFILINLSNKPVDISHTNGRLVTEEIAQYEKPYYRPISFFVQPPCGIGSFDLLLQPGNLLIIQDKAPNTQSANAITTSVYLRLKIKGGILNSGRYKKNILPTDFFLAEEYETDFQGIQRRLPFNE